jgi:hypothetical protein
LPVAGIWSSKLKKHRLCSKPDGGIDQSASVKVLPRTLGGRSGSKVAGRRGAGRDAAEL